MNSGSFFRLDIETSKVENGIAVFEYIDLPDFGMDNDELSYPVRLSITSDAAYFYVHYFKGKTPKGKTVFKPRHEEEIILRLPYKTNNSYSLSSIIKRIYNTIFPLSDYLQRLMTWRYEKDIDNKLEDELKELQTSKTRDEGKIIEIQEDIDTVKRYRLIKKSQSNKDSYSSLYIWGLLDNADSNHSSYQLQDKNGNFTKFLRKLLLDFMFDLMHSDVFESSKYYSQMKEDLMTDFFFSSIIKKSEYYYQRDIVRNRYKPILYDAVNIHSLEKAQNNNKDATKSLKKLYINKLDEAESEWIDTIMNPMAEKHFVFSPEWYENQDKPVLIDGEFFVSNSWFVNPEEEMGRIIFPLPEHEDNHKPNHILGLRLPNKNKIHYINSFELSQLIGAKDDSSIINRNTKISKWYYSRFDFRDAFRMIFSNNWNWFFVSLLVIFECSGVFCMKLWACPKNLVWFPLAACVGYIVSAIVFKRSISYNINSDRIDDILVIKRREREYDKAINGVLFCSSIILFLLLFQSSSRCSLIVKSFALFSVLIVLFIRIMKDHIIKNIHLFLPRLVASITAAWIMLVIGNDLVKESLSWPICIILLFIVFVFILYESNKSLPNITTCNRIKRALELLAISFSISLIVGIFAINILTPSIFIDAQAYHLLPLTYHNWYLIDGCKDLYITIYPKYLTSFSFLATFIGVFIQMIFEEKKITEM